MLIRPIDRLALPSPSHTATRQMMEAQLAKDWAEIYAGLVDRHPDILGGLTLHDYRWAYATVWSRAVGAERDGRCVALRGLSMRACVHG